MVSYLIKGSAYLIIISLLYSPITLKHTRHSPSVCASEPSVIFFLDALPQSPAPLLISLSYQSHMGHSPLSTPPSFSTHSLVLVCAFPVLRNSPPGLLRLKSSSSQRSSTFTASFHLSITTPAPAPQMLAPPLPLMLTCVVRYLLPQSPTGRRATSELSLTGWELYVSGCGKQAAEYKKQ